MSAGLLLLDKAGDARGLISVQGLDSPTRPRGNTSIYLGWVSESKRLSNHGDGGRSPSTIYIPNKTQNKEERARSLLKD